MTWGSWHLLRALPEGLCYKACTVPGTEDTLDAQGEKRNRLILGSVGHPSLEETKVFKLKVGRRKQLVLPLASGVWGVLGSPWLRQACPWSSACSEVTSSCVETTSVKCHGNEPGCHPHRAQRLGQFQAEARQPRPGTQNTEHAAEKGRVGCPQAPLSLLRLWPVAMELETQERVHQGQRDPQAATKRGRADGK